MDREKAQKILGVYGQPVVKDSNNKVILYFARQTPNAVEQIEKLSNEELISHWKSLVWMNMIYGQVSLNELQRIDLLDLEIDERKLDEGLKEWYDEKTAEFEKNEENLE